jgi:hypothetical protein
LKRTLQQAAGHLHREEFYPFSDSLANPAASCGGCARYRGPTKGGCISMNISHKPFIIILLFIQLAISACSFNMIRYTDGPLTQYLGKPLPDLDKPLARSLSVEKVEYNTAASMKGTMISDLVAREIYIFPSEVGREVDALLKMDEQFSEKATLAALNTIAKRRIEARHMWSGGKLQTPSRGNLSSSSEQYIKRHEELAKEAYKKGDYLSGNINNAAVINMININRSFAGAQATVDFSFSILSAAKSAGEALIKHDFNKLRRWIEQNSGAISPKAPEGTHLSVFLLRYFDAESFQLDSRMRVAV